MNFDLSGRSALITGASSGLGAHFGGLLAQAGARVILAARRVVTLEAVRATIVSAGGICEITALDVTDARSVEAIADQLADADILINNAGVVREAPAVDQTEADWDDVIDTNLKGMFLMSKAAAVAWRKCGRGGTIVNIASILGLRQAGNALPYSVSKAGVIQLTKAFALELARFGIRVNALAPGYIDTDLNGHFWESDPGQALLKRIPQRRLGRLHDLDGPLLLLVSDASAYMTGAVLAVDGGHLVSTL